jgi:hypothetical protein
MTQETVTKSWRGTIRALSIFLDVACTSQPQNAEWYPPGSERGLINLAGSQNGQSGLILRRISGQTTVPHATRPPTFLSPSEFFWIVRQCRHFLFVSRPPWPSPTEPPSAIQRLRSITIDHFLYYFHLRSISTHGHSKRNRPSQTSTQHRRCWPKLFKPSNKPLDNIQMGTKVHGFGCPTAIGTTPCKS